MSQFNPGDFLDQLPPDWRTEPWWQFMAEMLRVDAEFRTVYMQEGAGGFSTGDLDMDRIVDIVDALRALPADAARQQIVDAVAPFKIGQKPEWQLISEMLRVDAEFRKAYFSGGASGLLAHLDFGGVQKILAVLRPLPDDAPKERIAAALAPFRIR